MTVPSNSPVSPEKIKTGLRIKYGMTDPLIQIRLKLDVELRMYEVRVS